MNPTTTFAGQEPCIVRKVFSGSVEEKIIRDNLFSLFELHLGSLEVKSDYLITGTPIPTAQS